MNVRLGIVAPRRSLQRFEAAAAQVTGMEPRWLLYDSERGIPAVVARGLDDCDALCFSGDLPRERSEEVALPPDMPISVVRLTSVDVALCLLRARDAGRPVTPLSVDTAAPEIIGELTDQLGLEPDRVAHLAHRRDLDVDDVIAFHREAHARIGTAIAVTGRSNAVPELEAQLGIPVFPAVPVVSSIRGAMNRAVLAAANRHQADKSFAAAVLRVVARGDLVESEVRRLAMARALHDVVELSEAWVEARSGGQDVLVFGHRRLMQRLTHDWTAIPLIHELERETGCPIAIGVGLGGSARRSVEFAETACNRAVRAGGRCGFVLSEEGVVIGPLSESVKGASQHRFRSEDAEVTTLARELGFGIPTITRLLNYEHELRGAAVSAADLGRKLMLSPQSGRRIARALDQHGLLITAGASQPAGRGRPTNLFRLNLRTRIPDDAGTSAGAEPAE